MSYTDKQGREWNELDEATLPTMAREAYAEYRRINRQAAAAREAFETVMRELLQTEAVQFGYKFGKLSFTVDVEARKPKASAKSKLTLDQWLEQRTTL